MTAETKPARKLRYNTPAEEAAIRRGMAEDPDNPELTDDDLAAMKPAAEVLPAEILAALPKRKGGRPLGSVAEVRKTPVTLRLDPDILEALRASGAGWQGRVNDVLRREFTKPAKRRGAAAP